jgi:hypothetical protein
LPFTLREQPETSVWRIWSSCHIDGISVRELEIRNHGSFHCLPRVNRKSESIFGKDHAQIKVLRRPLRVRRMRGVISSGLLPPGLFRTLRI